MVKKIGILVFVLVLAGGGFFYWQNNQRDIRELNKNLPAGVKIVKSIFGFGNEYRVVNKIDGYEFKVPSAWKGVRKAYYLSLSEEVFGSPGSTINIEGIKDINSGMSINYFKIKVVVENLKSWAEDALYNLIGFEGELVSDSVEGIEVVKTKENSRIFDNFIYFFKKNSVIYEIVGPSEEFIREIISNGKW